MTHNGQTVEIVYIPFPATLQGKIPGFISESGSGYIIGIDSTRSPQKQRFVLGHELAHLCLDHLRGSLPIKEQERQANRAAWHYYRLYKSGQLDPPPQNPNQTNIE